VYGGCDALIANRSFRVPINFDAELHMPFVPGMVVFYMSIYLLFLMGPFILRTRHEMRALIVSMAGITLIGGICFLIVPAELAFAPPGERDLGRWASLFSFADMLNLTYNLLPSLHVALSVVCVAAFASRARLTGKIVLWCWATGVAASTLLTHQHHILDVIGGVVLAIAIYLGVYVKKVHAMPYPAC
jgi:membrane-associated phospholipid phosphatase